MSTDATPDTVVATERCGVCAHDLARHDENSLRFCRATQSRALTRACICR